jgi:hypothetical protein
MRRGRAAGERAGKTDPGCCEICRDLDNAIARRDGEFIPRRGFMEIRERDPGGVPRDARWRGGRRKKNNEAV